MVNKLPLKATQSSKPESQNGDWEMKIKEWYTFTFLKFTVAVAFKSWLKKKKRKKASFKALLLKKKSNF